MAKKTDVKTVKVEQPKTARDLAWAHFCSTMEKHDPERYARMKAAGELEKIPDTFTY